MSEKAKSLLDRIKAVFADTLPTTYKLADGTDVTISLLDVGGDFMVGGQPAAEGTYTLQDGKNVTVDSTGKITAVDDPSTFAATEYTLSGGDTVQIDKLEVGGIVSKAGVPVAEGDWSLQDGTTLSTDSNGVITVCVLPTAAAPAAPAKMTKELVQQYANDVTTAAPSDQMSKLVVCVTALMEYCFGWQLDDPNYNPQEEATDAKQIADAIDIYKQGLGGQFAAKFTAQEKLITKQGETIAQMLKLMTELAEAPAGDPPVEVQRKTIFSGEVQKGKKAAIDRYVDAAQKLNEINN